MGASSGLADAVLICPLSGFAFDGKKINTHQVEAFWCKGERSLSGFCKYHQTRIFMCDDAIVKWLKENKNAEKA